MRITKLTDYALLLLCEMKEQELISSKQLSEKIKVPFATVNKLLRLLTQSGICGSKGGKTGGFFLLKSHKTISLLDVIFSIEGKDTRLTDCTNHNECQLKNFCKIAPKMQAIDNEIYKVLRSKFLSDLI